MLAVIFRNIKNIFLGWMICVPLACLIPKKKNLVLFMGRVRGRFFGNVKFLYLYANGLDKNDSEHYFFTELRSVYDKLRKNNLPVVMHPTLRSIYLLLRARVIIASSSAWIKKSKYHLLFKSRKVQIFHGLALKKVELGIAERARYNRTLKGKLDNTLRGRYPFYELLISTSKLFTDNLFANSFRTGTIIESGYPRNDIFFRDSNDSNIYIGCDNEAISQIAAIRARGFKAVLYAPTFRDTSGDAISEGILDVPELSDFAGKHKLVFVFKFHLSTDIKAQLKEYDNIVVCDNSSDIQPLMKISDMLITDYSSVYIDYLLLDRPVIFFPYDYEKYINKDRELNFDYDWITSGPKCFSQSQLQTVIEDIVVKRKDDFVEKRREIRDLAFKYRDGNSSERVWGDIRKYLIETD